MQKKLIALAVAGLISAPVMAQSNVTIYGIADAYIGIGKMGDNKFRGVQSGGLSGSRIGFRGTEDLGNGLKAVFTLEYGINVDTGDGITGARQSFVGLDGGFGFVGLGRQYSPGHNVSGGLDLFSSSTALSPQLLLAGAAGANIQGGGGGRFNNSINYKSKTYSGLRAEAMYAFGENADQANDLGNRNLGNMMGVGVAYKNGPISAGAAYHDVDGGAGSDKKDWFIGGGYNFGIAEVNATYQQTKTGSAIKNKVWTVAGAIPVSSAGKVLVGYADLNAKDSDADRNAWTVAYTHSLSKRTTAYAGYRRVSNDDLANTTAVAGLSGAGEAGSNSSGLVVGVRHTF